jgi:hypothetical protein
MKSFALLAQPPAAWEEVWNTIVPLLESGRINPIVAKTFPLAEGGRRSALPYRGPPIRQDRPHHLTVLMYRGRGGSG